MTDEEIIAVVSAKMEGKTIQICSKISGTWRDCASDPEWNFSEFNYRVKMEPRYRPFKSADEVMAAIKKHGDWVKREGRHIRITEYDDEFVWRGSQTIGSTYMWAFDNLIFANDGTPFGKLVEE